MSRASHTRPSTGQALAAAAVFAVAVAAVAVVGSLAASSSADQYAMLQRPSWAPPSWLFGPVWTVLYVLIAFAGWRAWFATRWPSSPRRSMGWYGAGLVLNAAWTPLFFVAGARTAAFVAVVLLDSDRSAQLIDRTVTSSRAGAEAGVGSGLSGPPVRVPDDTPLLDRLLGLTGRAPAWHTGGNH